MDDPILMYVPGLAFLFMVNVAVAVPLAFLIKDKRRAVPISVLLTTAALKTIFVIQIGYFDVSFLLILLGVGLVTAVMINEVVEVIRGRVLA